MSNTKHIQFLIGALIIVSTANLMFSITNRLKLNTKETNTVSVINESDGFMLKAGAVRPCTLQIGGDGENKQTCMVKPSDKEIDGTPGWELITYKNHVPLGIESIELSENGKILLLNFPGNDTPDHPLQFDTIAACMVSPDETLIVEEYAVGCSFSRFQARLYLTKGAEGHQDFTEFTDPGGNIFFSMTGTKSL
ncbi:hypothetical protein KC717_05615 [Candidatus Dojkabacteria bacterium]|uniref:Uncharacterized protein n=1 Tax=Candidatus Dojkabacteria bacterium TaxID=2099670 RepID=A0A955RL98_9BACT|nr:hypothetical protein [Candidatus Dojkabacteria bacterium]